jgi:hypothetical protein
MLSNGFGARAAVTIPPSAAGFTSNSAPYAHFSYNFQNVLVANPTWKCNVAHSSFAYNIYLGNATDYLQMANSTNYMQSIAKNK